VAASGALDIAGKLGVRLVGQVLHQAFLAKRVVAATVLAHIDDQGANVAVSKGLECSMCACGQGLARVGIKIVDPKLADAGTEDAPAE
jgi:hypothetical protein